MGPAPSRIQCMEGRDVIDWSITDGVTEIRWGFKLGRGLDTFRIITTCV